jgi:hypothetical protein
MIPNIWCGDYTLMFLKLETNIFQIRNLVPKDDGANLQPQHVSPIRKIILCCQTTIDD